jgi:Domain of unknown function (DUF4292)
MKYLFFPVVVLVMLTVAPGCHTTKRITKAIAPKDTLAVIQPNQSVEDSLAMIKNTMTAFNKYHINFRSFSAKIKIDYQDSKGKQPDLLAKVIVLKDSAIYVSISATLFNLEVFRILITKDSITLMDTRAKEVQYRSIDYLQDATQIPFDFITLQDFIIGNPVFTDSNVVSFKKSETGILVGMVGQYFKNLLTLSAENQLLQHCKLDDVDFSRNRTADITYTDYENKDGIYFSSFRDITVSEKNRLDIQMKYKQWDFNKDLTISFRVPKNYKPN